MLMKLWGKIISIPEKHLLGNTTFHHILKSYLLMLYKSQNLISSSEQILERDDILSLNLLYTYDD